MERIDAALAHDLRMPLQMIYSCAQLIQAELDGEGSPAARYAGMLMDSVGCVQRLLAGALEDCGRAPRPAGVPRPVPGDLAACVRTLCRRCQPWADLRGVALTWGGAASVPMPLDGVWVERILSNLIANALRFTPPGGQVRVTWAALGDFAQVRVEDDGAGIPPARLEAVFLPGVTEGGHGLGLPIARHCAEALGGTLTARSTPGRGSAFTLRLPTGRGCESSH